MAIDLPQSVLNRKSTADKNSFKQRLSIERLKQFEALKFGMFIHWGMSTYDGQELSGGTPLSVYDPTNLDVDQWISVARDAGMKYAVLTVKHVAGMALWPTKFGEYSVKYAKDQTDVVGEFVTACHNKGIKPCFYYCAWDNTNLFGMKKTPDWSAYSLGMTTTNEAYREFMYGQLDELLDIYGDIEMMWIDMPKVLPLEHRFETYQRVTQKQPNIICGYNHSCQNGTTFDPTFAWPSDIMTMERTIPNHAAGHARQSYYAEKDILGDMYYIPGEYNDTIGHEWFWQDDDPVRSDNDLLGMVLGSTGRGVNCLLNVPPNREGIIPTRWSDALNRLAKNIDAIGGL